MSDGQIYQDDFMHVRLSMEAEDRERQERSRSLAAPSGSTPRPTVVCLCGSTRFWREFERASLRETMAGKIVLSIGAATGTDDEHFGNLPKEEYDRVKEMLDQLHLRKIDICDEVLVLNVCGYIGKSTAREICYAADHKKPIKLLEPFLLEESRKLLDATLADKISQESNAKLTDGGCVKKP